MDLKRSRSASAVSSDPVPAVKQRHNADQTDAYPCAQAPGPADSGTENSAEYIAILASQLQRIAVTNGHQFLAYLIDMVVVEAWRLAGPDADNSDPHERPVAARTDSD